MESEAEFHGRMVRSFAAIGSTTVVLAAFGLFREGVVAMKFGASSDLDAFLLSFSIAYFFPVLLTSTLQGTFIPSFHRTNQEDPEKAKKLANVTLNLLAICLVLCTLLVLSFGKSIIQFLAPGFSNSNQILAFSLLLSLVPTLLLTGINEQLKNTLNALKVFGLPSLTQILPSAATILTILLGTGTWGIFAFAFGWNIGLLAQTVALARCLKWKGGSYRFALDLKFPELRKLLRESLPYLVVPLTVNGILFVDKYFASLLGPGVISYFNYAEKLFRIPWMIIGTTLFTVALPFFSERVANRDFSQLRNSISLTLRLGAFLTIPVASGMAILGKPLVSAVFQRGAFKPEDTASTAIALMGFMGSLLFYALSSILDRALCALGSTRTLMKLATATMILKILLAWIMTRVWGLWGLAFSTAPALMFQSAVMYVLLGRAAGRMEFNELVSSLAKVLLATFLMAVLIFLVAWFGELAMAKFGLQIPNILVLVITICLGASAFWIASLRMKSKEAAILLEMIQNVRK